MLIAPACWSEHAPYGASTKTHTGLNNTLRLHRSWSGCPFDRLVSEIHRLESNSDRLALRIDRRILLSDRPSIHSGHITPAKPLLTAIYGVSTNFIFGTAIFDFGTATFQNGTDTSLRHLHRNLEELIGGVRRGVPCILQVLLVPDRVVSE